MSRLLDDPVRHEPNHTEVIALQREVVDLMQLRSHHLTLELPSEPLWVDGDPTRLQQTLGNLLDNSGK